MTIRRLTSGCRLSSHPPLAASKTPNMCRWKALRCQGWPPSLRPGCTIFRAWRLRARVLAAPCPDPPAQIVVVANPANTNATILAENAPGIPRENITCLTRLDHNRALGQVGGSCWKLGEGHCGR